MAVDFARVPVFSGLCEQELECLRSIFEERRLPAGSVVIREEDFGEEMFLLVEGRVQVSKAMLLPGMSVPLASMEGTRKVLANLDDSAMPIFGEVALIDSDQRSATVLAVTECRFLVTDRARFFGLAEREPALGVKLLATLGRRMAATIRRANAEVVKLTTALALSLRKND